MQTHLDLTSIIVPVAVLLAAILGISIVVARLYIRAGKDRAYVRTGLGGQKVVLDGGSVVLPIFQNILWVNLQTVRLDVRRDAAEAMITKDRMRVDITVDFYVRVKPDIASIALAAQTLGNKTNEITELRQLVEAKFVDTLRNVAATMTLSDLQANRASFVQTAQTAAARDLELNGLELEAASLTRLDQTDMKFFNPNNAFDAEGLTALTRIAELKKQERNQIMRGVEVSIAQQDLEAKQKTLEIERQKQESTLMQERDVANKTASTHAETAEKTAQAKLAQEQARIAADQAIAERQAEADRARETARIAADLAIKQQRIESERTAETLNITKRQVVELAEQDRSIAVAERSRAQSEAQAEAERARALAVAATESVETTHEVARAERERQTAVIAARKEAEQQAAHVTIAAEAARAAAENQAEAARLAARGEADSTRIRAEAKAAEYAVEAEGQRRINEARNTLAPAIIELEIVKERLRIIPQALAEAVKPMEKIGDVRIIDLNGWMPNGGTAHGGTANGAATPTDGLLSALLQYRANAPILDGLLAAAGFSGANPVDALLRAAAPQEKSTPPTLVASTPATPN